MAKDSEVLEGTQEEATSEGSKGTGQQSSVATDANYEKTLRELQAKYDQLARQIQSDKDRAVKKTNERLDVLEGDIRDVLRVAQREGKSVGDILTELNDAEERETRQLMKEFAMAFREGKVPQAPVGQTVASGVDVSAVLETLDLDAEDTRVQAFRAKSFASEAEAYREGALLRKQILTTQPSDADRVSDVSKARRPAAKQDELMQEYREGSKNLYGRQLIIFKQKMREKGLEIT